MTVAEVWYNRTLELLSDVPKNRAEDAFKEV